MRIPKSILCFIIVLSITGTVIKAQRYTLLNQYEDTLKVLAKDILYGESDFIKYDANERFQRILLHALISDESFDYPFDSLTSIARLRAPDNNFRIFNWNLPKSDGTYVYYGIIQTHKLSHEKYKIYVLEDKSSEIESPEQKILSYSNWYGSLYYKIIKNRSKNKDYYTLLGWDGNNKSSTKKIIEILSFRSNGDPVFGAYLFKRYKKKTRRAILEYSSSVIVSLKYEEQTFSAKRSQKSKKEKKIKKRMIVFDRLMPMDPQLEGQYEFYVPTTNIFDGFVFHNGKWIFIKDIDARNPERKSSKKQTNEVEYDLFPPEDENSN